MRCWLVSFDIGNARRRRRAVRLLLAHGQRVQESVFVLALHAGAWQRLTRRLQSLVDPDADQWRAWRLCENDLGDSEDLGLPSPRAPETLSIV